jgi:hypothetical protein
VLVGVLVGVWVCVYIWERELGGEKEIERGLGGVKERETGFFLSQKKKRNKKREMEREKEIFGDRKPSSVKKKRLTME